MLWWPAMKTGSNAMTRDQETEFPVQACWLSQAQKGQTEQIHPQTFDDPFLDSTSMIYMHWVPTGQTVNKEYYVEVLREFRKRFRQKRPARLQIGSVAFPPGQYISPQLHPCHRLFDQDGHQHSSPPSPKVKTLLLVTFGYSPKLKGKLRGCRYETIEEMKEACDEGHWHAHTRGLP